MTMVLTVTPRLAEISDSELVSRIWAEPCAASTLVVTTVTLTTTLPEETLSVISLGATPFSSRSATATVRIQTSGSEHPVD